MRILIIDDDEDLCNLLAHYIRQEWPEAVVEPFDPVLREMPDAAFPLGSYDVVLLDYMLGRGDGLVWLQAFASTPPRGSRQQVSVFGARARRSSRALQAPSTRRKPP